MPGSPLSAVPSVAPPADRGDHWITTIEVQRKLGAAEATIYRLLQRDPTFPRPAKLGGRNNRWSARAIDAWMAAQVAAAADR